MIKIGLVDNRVNDLEKLKTILEREPRVMIDFATTNPEEALALLKRKEIHILITDIEMPTLSGYELADLIQANGLDIQVIFVTGYSGYAVHAFELDVLDYILKPYTRERLLQGIERFMNRQGIKHESERLLLKSKTAIDVIAKNDIIFIERTGRSTTIITINGEFSTYQSLIGLETELTYRHFIRSHRGFILNINFIKNFALYTKHSYRVAFHHTNKTAMITKTNLAKVQAELM